MALGSRRGLGGFGARGARFDPPHSSRISYGAGGHHKQQDQQAGHAARFAQGGARELVGRADDSWEMEIGWDHVAEPASTLPKSDKVPKPQNGSQGRERLRADLLSLFGDPRVGWITAGSAATALGRDVGQVENALEALAQAGELRASGSAAARRFEVDIERKEQLEELYMRSLAPALSSGELARTASATPAIRDDSMGEPRLPVTAGLLSLFLPGTGQLLNGDIARAAVIFSIWSLAWVTHLSPIWAFVCLYAGAEAFFTAKVRNLERKLGDIASNPKALKPATPRELG